MTVTFICFLLSGYISELVRETDKRQSLEKQLRYDATHDSLTGLYNRAWFIDRLQQTNSQTDKNSNRLFALLFLDLDRFKVVNDTLGHTVGDKLLSKISQQLEQCLPESAPVARLGGDEFTVILEQVSDSQVSQIAETVCQSLGRTYTVNGYEIFTTVSVGVALNKGDRYNSALDWLRDADIALYEAKSRGKSRYTVFDETMYQKVRNQAQLEQDLRKAIDELND